MENASKANVPKKVIENALKRAAGGSSSEGASHVAVYEAMGPGGVAIVVETLTDNKNRTLQHVRDVMTKGQASMSPCSYLFYRRGWIDLKGASFEEVFEYAAEIGAEDVEESEQDPGIISVYTDPTTTSKIAEILKTKYKIADMGIEYAPNLETAITDLPADKRKSLDKIMSNLEDLDDVTNVYCNLVE